MPARRDGEVGRGRMVGTMGHRLATLGAVAALVVFLLLCGFIGTFRCSLAEDAEVAQPPKTYLLRYRGPAGTRLQYVCTRERGGVDTDVFLTQVSWRNGEGDVLRYRLGWTQLTSNGGFDVWDYYPEETFPRAGRYGGITSAGREVA